MNCNHPQAILRLMTAVDNPSLRQFIHNYLNNHCDQLCFDDKLQQIINDHNNDIHQLAFSVLALMASIQFMNESINQST